MGLRDRCNAAPCILGCGIDRDCVCACLATSGACFMSQGCTLAQAESLTEVACNAWQCTFQQCIPSSSSPSLSVTETSSR